MPLSYDVVPSEESNYDHLRPETGNTAGIELPNITVRPPLSHGRSDDSTTPDHDSYVSEDDGGLQPDHGYDTHYRGPATQHTHHSRDGSRIRLVAQSLPTYRLERYIPRSVVNTLGPVLIVAFYATTVWVYLLRPPINDVVPIHHVNANLVFYGWVLISIFVLDWAKSGLAGFEASALMNFKLAPGNAMALMWHADRAWGSVSGWWKASVVLYRRLLHLRNHKTANLRAWPGPDWLWLYLALSSILFYAAIPLASLTMGLSSALRLDTRDIVIMGANQTTFDVRSSNIITEEAAARWRQGNAATPQDETIFYAPDGSQNVSSTFFNDAIEAIYQKDLLEQVQSSMDNPISFFSGPRVAERVHGKMWGLLTNLSCAVANPYTQLTLINMTGINNWSVPTTSTDSNDYGTQGPPVDGISDTGSIFSISQSYGGTIPTLFALGDSNLGASYAYLIAVDSAVDSYYAYDNASSFPTNGILELVMWQTYGPRFTADQEYNNMSSNPAVVSSKSLIKNRDNSTYTYLGYAIKCSVNSSTGFANVRADTRTYADFTPTPATLSGRVATYALPLNLWPGIVAIQSIVYGAFTTAVLSYVGLPTCSEEYPTTSITCNPWYTANVATGGSFLDRLIQQSNSTQAQQTNVMLPTTSPARMKLAMYKLFAEASVAMMASGGGDWVSGDLQGVTPATALVTGPVPWQLVLYGLLLPWAFITVLPSLWTFSSRRWAATLDGLQMFRLGAEWKETVWKFSSSEVTECEGLHAVPGMIGDMEIKSEAGFIGLSKNVASDKRTYIFDRGSLHPF